MRKKIGATLATIIAIVFASSAQAQGAIVEYTIAVCGDSIEKFCDQVTLGEGRMLFCLAAHEDKVSEECGYALHASASVIEELTAALVTELRKVFDQLAIECGRDINEHCSTERPGEGNVVGCLKDNEKELTENCTTAMTTAFGFR